MPDQTRREVLRGSAAGAGLATIGTAAVSASGNDRKIVGLAAGEDFGPAKAVADSVHRTLDFGDVGKAVAGNFSEQAIDRLRANHDVRYVENDGLMHALPGNGPPGGGGSEGECLPWGVDRTDADVAHANGETGSGADIAIVDTGIDDDHPDLQANVGKGKAFVECKGGNCNYAWSDDDDHGTHCAGIADAVRGNEEGVQGVSTEATLHAVKVLDKSGSGTFSDVADGIRYVADQGWDVASLSLGASSGSQTVKDAGQYAYDKGVLLVAAAGNDGPCSDCVGYPAAYSEFVAVSSTDSDDSLSSFSSTGPEVEIAAPGGSVYSTVIGGYDTFSGTSMACPHVSGAGGQLMANGVSNKKARSKLKNNAEDLGLGDNEQGAGLLDVADTLGYDSSDDGTGDC
ncbi:peptidase S8 [Halobacteriales archaeon QS_1_68_20]|nr:MAG: peptidase S8 [Halobacteriales archaeon QS_1_68_20]